MYEVRMTKHWSGETYNVDLVSWQRNGEGMSVGKAFNVSRKKADKEADRVAKLYKAKKVLIIVPGE
tara:strand:+ start:671 stop:868 length:198 start_codon:yes stop_codon:yes gene_type:complete